jgi:hypothetical protein
MFQWSMITRVLALLSVLFAFACGGGTKAAAPDQATPPAQTAAEPAAEPAAEESDRCLVAVDHVVELIEGASEKIMAGEHKDPQGMEEIRAQLELQRPVMLEKCREDLAADKNGEQAAKIECVIAATSIEQAGKCEAEES